MNGLNWDAPRTRWLALALLLLFAFAFQGTRGLWSPDEGRYTQVAVEMLKSGDFIHPQLHPEHPHYAKPPLTYWAIAASVAALGWNEWAVRAPYALAFVLTVWLVFRLGRELVPARPWLPPLIYASMLLPYIAANSVTTDALLALFTTLYGFAFVRARALQPDAPHRNAVLLLWLGAGLAFMVKGPPALLPLAGLLVFAWSERKRHPLGRYLSVAGLSLFAVVALAWFAKVALDRPEVMRYFLVEEVYNRVASDAMHRNAQWYGAFTIYLPTLLLGTLPWTWLPLRATWLALRNPRAAWSALRLEADARLLACWIVLPLAVFCIARSRLPFYLLPLFAPLSLAMARALPASLPRRFAPLMALWLLALIGFRFGFAHWTDPHDDRVLAAQVRALPLEKIDEIVFVDTAPRYGLGFYLGSEIERASADERERTGALGEQLRAELSEDEGCRLLLVEANEAGTLEQALERIAGSARDLGAAGTYRAFVVSDGSCRVTSS